MYVRTYGTSRAPWLLRSCEQLVRSRAEVQQLRELGPRHGPPGGRAAAAAYPGRHPGAAQGARVCCQRGRAKSRHCRLSANVLQCYIYASVLQLVRCVLRLLERHGQRNVDCARCSSAATWPCSRLPWSRRCSSGRHFRRTSRGRALADSCLARLGVVLSLLLTRQRVSAEQLRDQRSGNLNAGTSNETDTQKQTHH